MDFLKDINEDVLLVIPSNLKEKALKKINELPYLVNIKIVSFNDLKKDILFDFDGDAILYLMDKYNYKYEVSKMYIENMYYVYKDSYESYKLNNLVSLKNELFSLGLLRKKETILKNYKNKKLIVFGYDYIDMLKKYILDNFTNVKIIESDSKYLEHKVYELNTLDDEVKFIFDKVMHLLKDGVSLSNIYFTNVTDEYLNTIKKYSYFYGVPVSLDLSYLLSTTIMFKNAFSVLKDTQSFESAVKFLDENYDLEKEENMEIYKKIITLFNKYNTLNYSFDKILEAIKYNSNNIKNEDSDEGIKISPTYEDDDYVFLMGFNRGCIPLIHKDEEFISDSIKDGTLLELVKDLNKIEKVNLLKKITSIKNLTMSYKLKNKDEEFYASILALDNFKIEKGSIFYDCSYSDKLSCIYLASLLDELIKYDKKDEKLDKYYNTFQTSYREYDNSYKKIDKNMLRDYLNNKLVLSYSSLDNYFKCEFKYLIENILKLNKYEESFDTFIGNLFHYVLRNFYNDDFDLDREYDNYLKDKTFSIKEDFYLKKLKKELKIICDRLKDFDSNTLFKNVLCERKIQINKDKDIEVVFKGFIDKIMYLEKNKTLVSVIDYKIFKEK